MGMKLTAKAAVVLDMLLNTDQCLTASQITAANSVLNINTVQNVLRILMREGYIEVADIVYSGTVLCRSYRPTAKARSDAVEKFADQFDTLRKNVPLPAIFSALVDKEGTDPEVIAALEKVVERMKASFKKEAD